MEFHIHQLAACILVLFTGLLSAARGQESPAAPERPAAPQNQPAPDGFSDPAAALLQKLSPDSLRAVGELLDRDVKEKPEWVQMAIAIFRGEAMTFKSGWWKESEKRYDWKWLADKFDKNLDRAIEPDELGGALADPKHFVRLDRDFDGKLTPDDFDWFSRQLFPNPQRLMADNLFFMLDADSNGRIASEEVAEFFRQADQESQGFLTAEDFSRVIGRHLREANQRGSDDVPSQPELVRMFFAGELGCLESGPELNAEAPDFTLATYDGARTVTLSASRGKRPVVLIFGSFT